MKVLRTAVRALIRYPLINKLPLASNDLCSHCLDLYSITTVHLFLASPEWQKLYWCAFSRRLRTCNLSLLSKKINLVFDIVSGENGKVLDDLPNWLMKSDEGKCTRKGAASGV